MCAVGGIIQAGGHRQDATGQSRYVDRRSAIDRRPVTEITVAGNLIEVYGRVVPGADLEFRGAANAPSLLIDDLAIAGK